MKWILLTLLSALGAFLVAGLAGCAVATPFRGPGFDRRIGVTLADEEAPVVVAVTHAQLESKWGARRQFFGALGAVLDELPAQSGLVGFSVRRRLFGNEAWTLSAWASHEDLNRFVASRSHQGAIARGDDALERTRFLIFEAPRDRLPIPWAEALALLESDERTYELTYAQTDE